jgi:Zn-dependent protease with chaperone function
LPLTVINKEAPEEQKEIKAQSKFLISSISGASRKLHDIAWPIMMSNIDVCLNSKINAFGLMVAHMDDLPLYLHSSFLAASPITLEVNNDASIFPMIVSVANNSPADRAKLMEGDIILSINNKTVNYKNYKILLDESAISGKLNIKIKRFKQEFSYELNSESICGYPVQAMISPIPNAYADGSKIYITIATLDFVKDDQEIAFLISHELAHNIFHYNGEPLYESKGNPIPIEEKPSLKNITDLLILQTEKKETEADLYGVEFAIKAGIAQDKVANYFRRLSIYMPQLMKDSLFRMHPGNARRVADIEFKLKALKTR